MTRQTIEKYLDECYVLSLKGVHGDGIDKRGNAHLISGSNRVAIITKGCERVIPVLEASREMLIALIEGAIEMNKWFGGLHEVIYCGHIKAIESALPGKTWPEIRARLEEIESTVASSGGEEV